MDKRKMWENLRVVFLFIPGTFFVVLGVCVKFAVAFFIHGYKYYSI